MERHIERIKGNIAAKDPPLRVAQTRLKKRTLRPEVENCADEVYHYLVEEVKEISKFIRLLETKNEEAKATHRELLKNVEKMENDLKTKKNSLLIDQQKCMSIRRNFPFLVVSSRYP